MGRYLVWEPSCGQTEEDAKKISASDPECAVRKWAEWSDSASSDYHIVGGQPTTVMVRDLDSPKALLEYEVSGESRPVYYARAASGGEQTNADKA